MSSFYDILFPKSFIFHLKLKYNRKLYDLFMKEYTQQCQFFFLLVLFLFHKSLMLLRLCQKIILQALLNNQFCFIFHHLNLSCLLLNHVLQVLEEMALRKMWIRILIYSKTVCKLFQSSDVNNQRGVADINQHRPLSQDICYDLHLHPQNNSSRRLLVGMEYKHNPGLFK